MPKRSICQKMDLERRRFISRLGAIAGETAVLGTIAGLIASVSANGAETKPDDMRLKVGRVTVVKHAGRLQCYSARPASPIAPLGGVVVMHDTLGLTPHYEDVTRRLALEGFAALAPDYASRYGGSPAEPDPAREVVGMVTWPEMIADTNAAVAWLKMQGGSSGRVAAVGFGFGGSALGRAVTEAPDLAAAVTLYGRVPPLANVSGIKAPLLLIYAADDPAVNADVPAFVDALRAVGQHPEVITYPAVRHGFDDDTQPARYNAETANLAWARIVQFLRPLLG
jgi:carboxymethylenebutenolidase